MRFLTYLGGSIATLTLWSAAGVVTAQNDVVSTGQTNAAAYYPAGYGYGGGYGAYAGGHASTAQEGYARGMADVIRSRGDAAVSYSQAATQAEQARREYLENRNFAVRSFVENRAIRDEYRANADNTFYKSKEKLAAYVEKRKLQPLSRSEFYEATGEISWPLGLMHPDDEEVRTRVQELFTLRAKNGSLEPAEYVELNRLIRDWRMNLNNHRDDFSSSEITNAARFLGRLELTLKGDFE